MDGDKSEHLLEAIPVMGSFCDLIGVRSFAGLKDRDYDYAETIVNQFVKYITKTRQSPVCSSARTMGKPFMKTFPMFRAASILRCSMARQAPSAGRIG